MKLMITENDVKATCPFCKRTNKYNGDYQGLKYCKICGAWTEDFITWYGEAKQDETDNK